MSLQWFNTFSILLVTYSFKQMTQTMCVIRENNVYCQCDDLCAVDGAVGS